MGSLVGNHITVGLIGLPPRIKLPILDSFVANKPGFVLIMARVFVLLLFFYVFRWSNF